MDKSDFAMIVSVASFVWGVFWAVFLYRSQKKRQEEEGKERVEATFIYDPHPAVKVVSTAKVPVYLTGVRLSVEKAGALQHYPFHTIISHHCLPMEPGTLGKEHWQLTGRAAPDDPLQRGEPYIFVLPKPHEEAVRAVLRASHEDDVSITVHSHTEELYRLKGGELVRFLTELVEHWEKPDTE